MLHFIVVLYPFGMHFGVSGDLLRPFWGPPVFSGAFLRTPNPTGSPCVNIFGQNSTFGEPFGTPISDKSSHVEAVWARICEVQFGHHSGMGL